MRARLEADIVITGGGSGGISAAYSAAKNAPGKRIILIENQSVLGGTGTIGGVNAWEPGCVGNSELHSILYNNLIAKNKVHLCEYKSVERGPYLVAHVDKAEEAVYENSHKRTGGIRPVYECGAMIDEINKILFQFGNLTVICNCTLTDVSTESGRIKSVTAFYAPGGETIEIYGQLFIDATSEIVLSRMSGCRAERSDSELNGISQIYIAQPKGERGVEPVPKWVYDTDAPEWLKNSNPDTIFNHYPDGRINGNTLCTIDGPEYLKMGAEAKKNALARTYAIWNFMQTQKGMDNYRLSYIFPLMGIREGYRLVGKYVLRENELIKGSKKQEKNNMFIAVADHAIDIHNSGDNGLKELSDCYGVPYECTLTNEIENLAVASRGISLTHIVAASCRLQRTIMQIGEGVGKAAAKAQKSFYENDIFEVL